MALSKILPASQEQYAGARNLIINGAMQVAQRGASAVTVNSPTRTYAVDRFFGFGTSSAGVFTEEQSTDVPSGQRFNNSSKITVTTNSSPSGSQTYGWGQGIEGLNTASLMFGSANAMTVTLSFWIKSSLTGTFSVILANNGGARTYPATYTISSANTWEYQTITVAGDQSGTWNTDNTEGLSVLWMLGTGSSLHGTANAWGASKFGVSGQTDLIATNGATLYITGVQLEVGEATPFEHRSFGDELARCQRYGWRIAEGLPKRVATGVWNNSTSADIIWPLPVQMRAAPTLTVASNGAVLDFAVSWHNATSVTLSGETSNRLASLICSVASSGATQGDGAAWGGISGNNPDAFLDAEL